MSRAAFTRETADIRRQALIDATAASLAEKGVAGTTVRAICTRAGVSPGLLRHYFDGIDALIAETYRAVTFAVRETLAAAVAAADGPRDRVIAYIAANFRPPVADAETLATWVAFWGLMKSDATIAAIHTETYGSYRAELETLLAECGLQPARCRTAAIALTALIDGLWLERTLDPSTFTSEEAEAMAIRWLDALLAP